ncbi:cytidylate kinase family protein [Mycolicibacterium peregrinum]|uniref:cytidylate kinase family protein n=1 Tax=Mycolicibacterium peregrinum TaxID=43304 RepID=UPI003AAC4F46
MDTDSGAVSCNKIVISGLTAAGKTTHTKLLAHSLGFGTLHFTDILLDELGVAASKDDQVWFHRFDEVESLREGYSADRRADDRVADALQSADPLIVDATLAPWLNRQAVTLNIWIGSDRASRAWKCVVSRLPGQISTDDSLRLIDEKDNLTRTYLRRLTGSDYFVDRTIFDIVLDNSHLIAAPTRADADQGIALFQEVLQATVEYAMFQESDALGALLDRDDQTQLSCIVFLREPILSGVSFPGPWANGPVIASRDI